MSSEKRASRQPPDASASPSLNSRERERAVRKKQTDALRKKSSQKDWSQSIRSLLQDVQKETDTHQFEEALLNGTSKEINNERLNVHREIEMERKTKRLSAKTFKLVDAFEVLVEKTVQDKRTIERIQVLLEHYRSPDKRNVLTEKEKIEIRKLVYGLRQGLLVFDKIRKDTLKLFKHSFQSRNRDLGEEKALLLSIKHYLQFVDAPQRARIETAMNQKMKDLPFDPRIKSIKTFIDNLVQTSPAVKIAEGDRLYEMALYFFEENQLDDAIGELDKASQYAPEDFKIYALSAQCCRMKNDLKQAIHYLNKAVTYNPENVEIILALAYAYEENKEPLYAIQMYQRVLTFRPGSLKYLTHLAKLSFDSDAWDVCIPVLNDLLEMKPRSLKTRKRLGIALIRSGDYAKGVSLLKRILEPEEPDAQIYLHLGIAYRAQEYYTDAFTSIETAAKLDPNDREITYWQAKSYFDRSDYEKTESLCQSLLREKQQVENATLLLAQVLQNTGKRDQAVELLQSLAGKGTPSLEILLEYGNVCMKMGKTEDAYRILESALKRFPGEKDLNHALGLACVELGRFQESIQYLDSATE